MARKAEGKTSRSLSRLEPSSLGAARALPEPSVDFHVYSARYMLSWIRRRFWPSSGERFANSVGQSLDWWLIGFDVRAYDRSNHAQAFELAKMHSEGRSIREATCMLSTSWWVRSYLAEVRQ